MAKYRVTGPDGQQYEVEGPDEATDAEVVAQVRSQQPKVGVLPAMGAGAMRMWDRSAHGLEQAFLGAKEKLGGAINRPSMVRSAQQRAAELAVQEEQQKERYQGISEQHPIASFAGEAIPYLLTRNPFSAALLSATEYGSPEERAIRSGVTYAGGKAGEKIVGAIGSRALQPIQDASTKAGLEAAERIGARVSTGQATGLAPLRYAESAAANLPGGAMRFGSVAAANQQAINRKAAESIGQQADTISEGVLSAARQQIGDSFDAVVQGQSVKMTPQFANRSSDALKLGLKSAEGRYQPSQTVKHVLEDLQQLKILLKNTNNVRIKGEQYQGWRTVLDNEAGAAFNSGHSQTGRALMRTIRELDDAMEQSLGGEARKAFQLARRQYADLLVLERGQVVEAGNVSAKKLGNALNTTYKAAYKEGKLSGPLMDIARYGEAFRPLPDSGTAQRLLYQTMLTGGVGAAGGMNPLALTSSVVAPWVLAGLTTTGAGQKYLTKGIAPVTPAIRDILRDVGAGAGVAGLLPRRLEEQP